MSFDSAKSTPVGFDRPAQSPPDPDREREAAALTARLEQLEARVAAADASEPEPDMAVPLGLYREVEGARTEVERAEAGLRLVAAVNATKPDGHHPYIQTLMGDQFAVVCEGHICCLELGPFDTLEEATAVQAQVAAGASPSAPPAPQPPPPVRKDER